ncbi:uncharacterized protein LOC127856318 [Dreissena polymorpha]|uniref:Transcobalamin-like C-terminal domain-containing protein n=1 Tax=Dreissena polymorpha TaxID=45954 RepID=A0A9D4HK57_DREPO|nr:uncharacterized protein LOC127856318 [Dreissena polymorpha]KAH3720453.1 hypothetical protein DPMN_063352 [Dreissena polymorpha]
MRIYLVLSLAVIGRVAYANGDDKCGSDLLCRSSFTYSVLNHLFPPYFMKSTPMKLQGKRPFLYYMQQAVEKYNTEFKNFTATYYPTYGYFIEGINGLMGNFKDNRTYWEFSNATFGPLDKGVSSYIPSSGDKVLFNFTIDSRPRTVQRTFNGLDPKKFKP